jgi:hypothetical protein
VWTIACLLPSLTRPFIKHTKDSGTRPGSPRTINWRWRVPCPLSGMDTHSVLPILGSVSPTLAAYYYLRAPTDRPPSRCSRCGHVLVPGTSHARIVPSSTHRKRARRSPTTPTIHCLRQSCATCGHVNNTLLHGRNVMSPTRPYPAVTVTPRTQGTDHPLPDPPLVSSSRHPTPQPRASPEPEPPIRSRKSRPKHKAGLQEMLARNRERQHEAANRGASGLTTFLQGL